VGTFDVGDVEGALVGEDINEACKK
jgi:hypothetical protein